MITIDPSPAATHDVVLADGLRVHYHDAGAGAPVIVIHGSGPGTTARSTLGPTIDLLARELRVIAPDMPGWGESSAVEYDVRVQRETLVQLMDALGIERAAFVGHSLGGARVLDLAAAHPERVSRIVLISSPAPDIESGDASRTVYETYVDPNPEQVAAFLAAGFYDAFLVTAELVERVRLSAHAHPEHCANFLATIAKGNFSIFDPSSAIETIAAPTLIIHGRNDRIVRHEAALRLVASIADSRVLLLNRCGHFPHIEHAHEVATATAAFIQDTIENS